MSHDDSLTTVDQRIEVAVTVHAQLIERLVTIPGVDDPTRHGWVQWPTFGTRPV